MISEEKIASLVTTEMRGMVRSLLQKRIPEVAAKLIREEIDRLKKQAGRIEAAGLSLSGSEVSQTRQATLMDQPFSLAFEQRLQEVFAPMVLALTRELAHKQVVQALPAMVERLVSEEIQKCRGAASVS